MADLSIWSLVSLVMVALMYGVFVLFIVWILLTTDERRSRAQYILVRLFFFKDFGFRYGSDPDNEYARSNLISTIKIFRLITAGVASINFMTALVLAVAGWWFMTVFDESGHMIEALELIVVPLLILVVLYSIVLLFLMNHSLKRLREKQFSRTV